MFFFPGERGGGEKNEYKQNEGKRAQNEQTHAKQAKTGEQAKKESNLGRKTLVFVKKFTKSAKKV